MFFSFSLFNHNALGQKSLHDVIGIFGHQLRALGHQAVWDKSNTKFVTGEGYMNVVVEGFTPGDYGSIHALKNGYEAGARFLCLATEEPTEKGFNHGTQKEMVERQKNFADAAKYLEGILHLVPGEHVTRWYGQFAPAAQAELGFANSLVRPNDNESPEFDFGFFGSLSPRRYKILKRLARETGTANAVRVVSDFATQEERDKAMRNARVIVQIRKFDEMGLVSSSRCNTALCCGRPVIAEPHELSHPWDQIIKFSESLEKFYWDARMMRVTWRASREDQFTKFVKLLPPEKCVGEPLKKIGLFERQTRRVA